MGLTSSWVTVTTSPTEIPPGIAQTFQNITIQAAPSNTEPVWVGDSAVTTSDGFMVAPGGVLVVSYDTFKDGLYGVSASGGQVLYLLNAESDRGHL